MMSFFGLPAKKRERNRLSVRIEYKIVIIHDRYPL